MKKKMRAICHLFSSDLILAKDAMSDLLIGLEEYINV